MATINELRQVLAEKQGTQQGQQAPSQAPTLSDLRNLIQQKQKESLRQGTIGQEAQGRNMLPYEVIKERFQETPESDKPFPIIKGGLQGLMEGLNISKKALLGATEAPQLPELQGASGSAQSLGQFLGQMLPSVAGATAGGLMAGPAGAVLGGGLTAFGTTPGNLEERAITAGVETAMPIGGAVIGKAAGGLAKTIPSLFKKTNPRQVLAQIEKKHDTLKDAASNMYEYTMSEASKRNIAPIEIEEGILEQVNKWLPNTKQNKLLIDKAKEGDVQSIHKLQSDLGKRAFKNKNSQFASDRDLGELQDFYKDELQNLVHSHLIEQCHLDLSHTYKQGKDLWRQLKDIYYSDNKIAKIFDERKKIPKDIVSYFGEESAAINKFLSAHPELEELLLTERNKKEAMNKLKSMGQAVTATGTLGGAKYLYDKLTN